MQLFGGGRSLDWTLPVLQARGLKYTVDKGRYSSSVTVDAEYEGVHWRLEASAYPDRGVEMRTVEWRAKLRPLRKQDLIEVRYQPNSGLTTDDELGLAIQLAFGIGRMLVKKMRSSDPPPAQSPAQPPANPNDPKEPRFHDPSGLLDESLRQDLRWWPEVGTNLDKRHLGPRECFFSLEYYVERSLHLRTGQWWNSPERLDHIIGVGERLITALRPHSAIEW